MHEGGMRLRSSTKYFRVFFISVGFNCYAMKLRLEPR